MTVQTIANGREGNHRNSQWAVNKVTAHKSQGSDKKKDVSYQTFFNQAIMAYRN